MTPSPPLRFHWVKKNNFIETKSLIYYTWGVNAPQSFNECTFYKPPLLPGSRTSGKNTSLKWGCDMLCCVGLVGGERHEGVTAPNSATSFTWIKYDYIWCSRVKLTIFMFLWYKSKKRHLQHTHKNEYISAAGGGPSKK